MAEPDQSSTPDSRAAATRQDPSVAEVLETVVSYAKQQTLEPLRHVGRWLGYGAIGAALIGTGVVFLLLGLLRLLQTEWTRSASGSLSWLAYLIVVVVGIAVLVLTLSRIKSATLYPPSKEEH